jgi:hypothetical protein
MVMITASKFGLLVFAPVLITFLLPALFLLPNGVLLTLIAILDPTIPLSSAASYDMWIIGPILAAIGLFFVGGGLYSLHLHGGSPRAIWLATWAVFSVALFLAIWVGVTVFTSIGASETPPHIFLRLTALIAAGLTLLSQALVIPWLITISRMLPGADTRDAKTPGNHIVELGKSGM